MIKSLEAVNVVLLNVLLIMVVQLALNWEASNCNTSSSWFQLAFIATIIIRIATQEAHSNRLIAARTFKAITLATSGCLLTALGIYQSYTIASHSSEFYYDPSTKEGSIVCYQNRIVYIAEVTLCFLTVIKDIVVVVMGNDGASEASSA